MVRLTHCMFRWIAVLVLAGCGDGGESASSVGGGAGTSQGGAGGAGGTSPGGLGGGGTGGDDDAGGVGGAAASAGAGGDASIDDLPDWRLADAVTDGTLYIWLDPDWPGWVAGPSKIECILNGSEVRAIDPVMAGLHSLDQLTNDAPQEVALRASWGTASSPWSEAQTSTPTQGGFERFSLFANEFHEASLSLTVTGMGPDLAGISPSHINRPMKLPSGAEVEYIGGPNSLFVSRHTNTLYNAQNPSDPRPEVPESRHRHFDPSGRFHDLQPLESSVQSFGIAYDGGAVEALAHVAVLGRVIRAQRRAVASVGLDSNGDPVLLRLDRETVVGELLDGRPFVVSDGSVRALHGTGALTTLLPGDVVSYEGVKFYVVERAGLVPPVLGATKTMDPEPAYATSGPEPDWSAWNGLSAQGTGLTVRPGFSTLHVYLQSASSSVAEVRFRPSGTNDWYPALPLVYDARTPASSPVDMTVVVAGNHRSTIAYLETGESYEVQVKQGQNVWTATAETKTLSPQKVTVGPVGVVSQDVTISEAGDNVILSTADGTLAEVTRASGQFVEIPGMVVLGSIFVNASDVILRDCESYGGYEHGVVLGSGVHGVRLIRPIIRGWGRPDTDYDPDNSGFQRQHHSGIFSNAGGTTSPYDILVMGGEIGVPRYPANAWEERNTATGSPPSDPAQGTHPWGSNAITLKPGSYRGQIVIVGTALWGTSYRTHQDCIGHDNNFTSQVGGLGADSYVGWTVCSGFTDDGFEWDGAGIASVTEHCLIHLTPFRPLVRTAKAALSISTGYWGPVDVRRNVFRRAGVGAQAGDGRGVKLQRHDGETGYIRLFNNLLIGEDGGRPYDLVTPSTTGTALSGVRYVVGRNNLADTANAFQTGLLDGSYGNDFDEVSNRRASSGSLAFVPGCYQLEPGQEDVGEGVFVPNVTDSGPFQSAVANRGSW